jgi:hypothetical protein
VLQHEGGGRGSLTHVVSVVGVALEQGVVAKPLGLFIGVGVAADPGEQPRVVDRLPLRIAEPVDLAEPERETLLALESLDDKTLWQVASSTIAPSQHERLSELLERQRDTTLAPDEVTELADLRRAADLLMLRKMLTSCSSGAGVAFPLAELETPAE